MYSGTAAVCSEVRMSRRRVMFAFERGNAEGKDVLVGMEETRFTSQDGIPQLQPYNDTVYRDVS